jgi:tRNA A37 threonylcarbamoyladenosine dehydratase
MNDENQYKNQFSGVSRLLGQNVFEKIKTAHVTVIGIGGVGSWSAESLVRSGVESITLIDLDDICLTNTNRQLHALVETVGQMKVKVLKERLLKINPNALVHAVEDFATKDTIDNIIPKKGVVIDAIDSLSNKAFIAAFCRKNSLPLVTCGAAAGKQDPTLIRCDDLEKSAQDNLLKRLKKKLRSDHDFPRTGDMQISAVFSLERAKYPTADGGLCYKKDLKDKAMAKMDCDTGMGSSSFVTGTFGFTAAYEAIKLL